MKDILFDIQERDIVMRNQNKKQKFDTASWYSDEDGYCVLKIESDILNSLPGVYVTINNRKYKVMAGDKEVRISSVSDTFYFTAKYHPSNLKVKIILNGATYQLKTKFWNEAEYDIKACQFPIIDISGKYVVKIIRKEGEMAPYACLYSANELDMEFVESQDQEAQLLSLSAPGNMYRFPLVGIDAFKYVNSVPSLTDLGTNIINQFESDGKSIVSASFDANTGNIEVEFSTHDQVDAIENYIASDIDGITINNEEFGFLPVVY